MTGRGYDRKLRRALLQPDRGLRRLRLSREPRGELRPARLRLGLDQVPLSGRVLRRDPQQPADGLLPAGPARARRARARRRGARARRQCERLGLHAGAGRGRRTAPSPCASASGRSTGSRRRRWRSSSRRAATACQHRAAGRVAGVSRFTLERLAEADAFRSLGLDRRAALWAVRRLDDRDPRAATADEPRTARSRRSRCSPRT